MEVVPLIRILEFLSFYRSTYQWNFNKKTTIKQNEIHCTESHTIFLSETYRRLVVRWHVSMTGLKFENVKIQHLRRLFSSTYKFSHFSFFQCAAVISHLRLRQLRIGIRHFIMDFFFEIFTTLYKRADTFVYINMFPYNFFITSNYYIFENLYLLSK